MQRASLVCVNRSIFESAAIVTESRDSIPRKFPFIALAQLAVEVCFTKLSILYVKTPHLRSLNKNALPVESQAVEIDLVMIMSSEYMGHALLGAYWLKYLFTCCNGNLLMVTHSNPAKNSNRGDCDLLALSMEHTYLHINYIY